MKLAENDELTERIYQLTKQLKGAPLKDFEKRALRNECEKAQGTPIEQVKQAVTKVLHATPAYIDMKRKTLEDVNQMVEDIRKMTEDGGQP